MPSIPVNSLELNSLTAIITAAGFRSLCNGPQLTQTSSIRVPPALPEAGPLRSTCQTPNKACSFIGHLPKQIRVVHTLRIQLYEKKGLMSSFRHDRYRISRIK